ncbi:GlcG/HbpS family heme-binding protein [Pseudomonas turukhanskensis]|uniref:GlcG/HbpS family heme-binding protein n=1 Tax=Pseudomonas turukhanskensis TaxID=1806536 RepID=UPI0022F343DD|nr:heme-binding protein [Pseudomonas turukhanskensis]
MTAKTIWPIVALALLCTDMAFAEAQATKPVITLGSAKTAISSTLQRSPQERAGSVITVVDDGGQLIYLERSDGAASGMVDASIKKAKSAALYGFSTKALEQQIVQGHPGFQNLPDILPIEGGVPVVINGQLAGAVGVAGGASVDDGAFAEKIAAALKTGN